MPKLIKISATVLYTSLVLFAGSACSSESKADVPTGTDVVPQEDARQHHITWEEDGKQKTLYNDAEGCAEIRASLMVADGFKDYLSDTEAKNVERVRTWHKSYC